MGRPHEWFGLDLLGCYCLGCLRVGRRRAFSPLRSIVSFAWAASWSWSAREWLLALGSSGGVELITMHAASHSSCARHWLGDRLLLRAYCWHRQMETSRGSKYELSKHPKTTVSIICYIHTLLGIRWMKRSSGTRSIGRDEREIQ